LSDAARCYWVNESRVGPEKEREGKGDRSELCSELRRKGNKRLSAQRWNSGLFLFCRKSVDGRLDAAAAVDGKGVGHDATAR
jgi:hypothetical protein